MKGNQANYSYAFSLLPQYIDIFKKRLRIAVIFGGNKKKPGSVLFEGLNSRPYKSYEAVANDIAHTLAQLGFQHISVIPDDMGLPHELARQNIHFAWLNTAGVQGYNPTAHTPSMLEMLGIPYVGHDPLNTTVLDNKDVFKRELQALQLPTAPFVTWKTDRGLLGFNIDHFKHTFGGFNGPFVVKPVSGRASLHVHIVKNLEELTETIENVYRYNRDNVIVEKYLPGREFAVSVGGYIRYRDGELLKQARPMTFSYIERLFEPNEEIFTSMDQRAISHERIRVLGDQPEDLHVQHQLKRLAQRVYWEFSLQSLVRLDIRMDEVGRMFILEANPKPDLKRPRNGVTSLTAAGLHKEHMTYPDLIMGLICDRIDYLMTHRSDIHPHFHRLVLESSHSSMQSSVQSPEQKKEQEQLTPLLNTR